MWLLKQTLNITGMKSGFIHSDLLCLVIQALPGDKAVRAGAEISPVGQGQAAAAGSPSGERNWSRALPWARACWHCGLEGERHSHGKAVEELFIPLILVGSWWLSGSLTVAGCSEVGRIRVVQLFRICRRVSSCLAAFPSLCAYTIAVLSFQKQECLLLPVARLTLESQTQVDGCVLDSVPA